MRQRIIAGLGDAGSANYLLPALPILRQEFDVHLHVDPDGAARSVLEKQKESFQLGIEPGAFDPEQVALVLLGTAGKAPRVLREATLAAQAAPIPVAWFGDFFNSGCEAAYADLAPDWIAVLDESSASSFARMRPQYPPKRMKVVGNPAFDRFGDFDYAQLRRVGRNRLRLTDRAAYIHYSASSLSQFDLKETLRLLIEFTEHAAACLSVAFHPADLVQRPEEVAELTAFARERTGLFIEGDLSFEMRAAAADLFVTDYSTTGAEAAILGTPTAFVMLESAQAYQKGRGGEFPFIPLLGGPRKVKAATGVFSEDHLYERLHRALYDETYRRKTRETLHLDFPVLTDRQARSRFQSFVEAIVDAERA
jgi:hypothetical protein